jgi:hypothetical protein
LIVSQCYFIWQWFRMQKHFQFIELTHTSFLHFKKQL